jgi:hypothetical protein
MTMNKLADNSQKTKKRFSRRTKIILGILVSLLVILITGISVVGTMLLDSPETFDTPELSEDTRLRCSALFEKVMMKAVQSKPGQIAEITLTPKDVNAIIATVGNADNFNKIIFGGIHDSSKINYKAGYKKGKFAIIYIADTKIKTPFGSHVKIAFSCTPVMTENNESVTVHSAAIGSFNIPLKTVEAEFKKELKRRKSDKRFKIARKIIIKTSINKDYSITITYYPHELRQLISGQLMKSILK